MLQIFIIIIYKNDVKHHFFLTKVLTKCGKCAIIEDEPERGQSQLPRFHIISHSSDFVNTFFVFF